MPDHAARSRGLTPDESGRLKRGIQGRLRAASGAGGLAIAGPALVAIVLHFVTSALGGYGYFRDELYYLACSRHLDLGYVDQPPLSIGLLALNRVLFGESLFALRLPPAIAAAAALVLTGLMARAMGGGRIAQAFACLASLVSLFNLGVGGYYSMNAIDLLLWALAAYLVVRLVVRDDPAPLRLWIALGVVLGLGLSNKIGVLWLCAGIILGMLLTPHRRWLRTKGPWIAGVIAAALFLPYVLWNMTHDFAHLEFMRNATGGKYSGLSPLTFLLGQALVQNPHTLPLWLAGLGFLLFARAGKRFRILGFIYLAALLVLLVNGHSKAEYLSPAYGMLFAAGGVALESALSRRPALRWVMPVYGVVLAAGLVAAPLAIPILPVPVYLRYAKALGVRPSTSERLEIGVLPQFYADMFGWPEKAQAVASAYNALPPEDRARCALFADNYGRCGAIDFFGKRLGFHPLIGRHNNYWLWGPRGYTGELMIILGGDLEDKQELFESVEMAGTVPCELCMPYESNLRVYVCRKLKVPLQDLWPRLKLYG